MVRHSHRSAAHDQRSADDQRRWCDSVAASVVWRRRRWASGDGRPPGGHGYARVLAVEAICQPMACAGTTASRVRYSGAQRAESAGSRGGRPRPTTTEVDRPTRRYAQRAGQAAGGRTDEQVSARHEAASRADQAAGARRSAWTAAGQHSALGGWSGEQARAVRTLASHGVRHVRQSLPNAPRVWTAVNKRFALRTSPHGRRRAGQRGREQRGDAGNGAA